MRLVFRKDFNSDPGIEADYTWTVVGQFENDADVDPDDDNGAARLRGFGAGEIVVIELDPAVLDKGKVADKKNPLVHRIEIPEPPKPKPLKKLT